MDLDHLAERLARRSELLAAAVRGAARAGSSQAQVPLHVRLRQLLARGG